MNRTFPTYTAANDYLIDTGWSRAKFSGGYYTKPGVRGDNPTIPMNMVVRIEHNMVEASFDKSDYFTIEFI